jgi:hypothetical protein
MESGTENHFESDLSFDSWVRHVFDHPVSKPEWYFGDRTEPWADEQQKILGYMTRLFEAPEFLMQVYSRSQVGEGLWFLAGVSASEYVWFLHEARVPWSIRYRTISSIPVLFERLFVQQCGDTLGHLDQTGDDLLNMCCYMWWDIFSTRPGKPEPRFTDAFLEAMASVLSLPSEACQESALHGLGHEQSECPDRVARIVDSFLDQQPDMSAELRHYALRARGGGVL